MGIEMFKDFAKGYEKKVEENKDVWIYTRVSSKEQELNKSLNTQIDNAKQCVKEKGFNVTQTYGGTYESASGDMTRKEFKKLIEAIRKTKKKPHAILLNTISRFSRTGGAGVSLATELIEDLRVHLYEVSTGRNTFTEEGKL
jgi:DNA invertase Pin-like site-specific DNA recombinase